MSAENDFETELRRRKDFGVISMDPPANSDVALPSSQVRLSFNRDLELATANPGTVWIVERESKRRVSVAIEVLSNRDIVLVPQQLLRANARYTVHVDGVQSDAGEIAAFDGRIYTRFHFQCRYRQFDDGNVLRYFRSTFDRRSQTRIATFAAPGPDGYPLTRDDVVTNRSEYAFDSDRDNTSVIVRSSPGLDNEYGNDDDQLIYRRSLSHSDRGIEHLYYEFAGADERLGTADDYEADISEFFYDDQDRRIASCQVDTGLDRVAFTADDIVETCNYSLATSTGARVSVTSIGPGADGVWRTEDDQLGPVWSRWVSDGGARSPRFESHNLAEDGTPTPGPTSLASYGVYRYDSAGRVIAEERYEGPGADGVWLTDDDAAAGQTARTYDYNGLPESATITTAGLDSALGTPDDAVAHRYEWCPGRYYNDHK